MLYIFIHIPRTGGTYIETSLFNHLSRENDEWLKHYHYVDGGFSDVEYNKFYIPKLSNRTKLQQKELVLITGHSTYGHSETWLKLKKEKRLFTIVRNPIERLLSSFNYRYKVSSLTQDPQLFSSMYPPMNENSVAHSSTANDYDTLYEWYCDINYEHNLQSKWIIKSFVGYDNGNWFMLPEYMQGADSRVPNIENSYTTYPRWMYYKNEEFNKLNWFDMAKRFLPEFWWVGTTDNLSNDIEHFSRLLNTSVKDNANKNSSHSYWTIDDVMKQPDIDKLIEAEKYDFQLYNYAKNLKRPF